MFITTGDEAGVADLILRPNRLAIPRRLVLSTGIIACDSWAQQEGVVVHIMTNWLEDLSACCEAWTNRMDRVPGMAAKQCAISGSRTWLGSGIKASTSVATHFHWIDQ